MNKQFRMTATFFLLTALGAACQETIPTDSGVSSNDAIVEYDGATYSSVTDKVSVGGADICEALGQPTGCDANFSLSARKYDDGSVKGQWQDTFGFGATGFIHVDIDCLHVVGNFAVLAGVITNGNANGVDLTGQRALTAVMDNGTSANDPADQLSFSFFPTGGTSCNGLVPGNFPLFNLAHGQVKVR